MSEIPGAISILNSNCFAGRNGLKPRYIICHGTAGGSSAAGIANYFASTQGGPNPVSATIVIDQTGNIVQCNLLADGAWANGVITAGHDSWWDESVNPNLITISIEHCKLSTDNSDALTPIQQDVSFHVIAWLCQHLDIPARAADGDGGVTGHFSMDPVNRSRCPGSYPWQQLWDFLANGTQPLQEDSMPQVQLGSGIGAYFTDSGNGRWHCTHTNVDLIGGNLAFWRSINGIIGLPLTNEIYLPQYPGTAIVVYERALSVSDPKKIIDNPTDSGPVYLLHINSGVGQQLVAKPLTDALQAQINALKGETSTAATAMQQALRQIVTIAQPFEAKP